MPGLKFWIIVPWHEALLWLQQNEDKTICIGDLGREYDWTHFEADLARALNLSNFLWFIPKEEGKENDRVIIERVETGEQGQLKQIKEMRTMAKTTNEYMEEVHTMAKFSDDYEDCLLITRLKDNNISIIAEEVQRSLTAQLIFSSQKARKIGEQLIVLANQIEGSE
jgi:hypothetical protein